MLTSEWSIHKFEMVLVQFEINPKRGRGNTLLN